MKKIPTLFVREGKFATREVNRGCEWVLAGEGFATRKWDGTACAIIGGKLYKRLEWDAQKGPAPVEWIHHDFDPNARSGHGWLPVGIGPEDWIHRLVSAEGLPDGTYELCGPRVGKNPDGFAEYTLVPHGNVVFDDCPRTFDDLGPWLHAHAPMEGVVWHHPDGRMVKIKRRDFPAIMTVLP